MQFEANLSLSGDVRDTDVVHPREAQNGRHSHSKQKSLLLVMLLFVHHSQTPVTTPSAHSPQP